MRLVVLLVLLCLTSAASHAQDSSMISKKRLYASVGTSLLVYSSGMAYLGLIWYADQDRVPFHWYDDSQGWLQMDKAGHAFSAYHLTAAHFNAFTWAGCSKKTALISASIASVAYMTPIELFDGLYGVYGFSSSDVVANSGGTLLYALQQALWNEQRIRFKFSYAASPYPSYREGTLGSTSSESFFQDYNAHTYWLSANPAALGLKASPSWLNLAIGYSGDGMLGEHENPRRYRGNELPRFERSRQWLLSADVDFTRIRTRKPWLKVLFKGLNLLKLPFPALELHSSEGLKWHWIYF